MEKNQKAECTKGMFFRHIIKQELYRYVELDENIKESFIMQFMINSNHPCFVARGNKAIVAEMIDVLNLRAREPKYCSNMKWEKVSLNKVLTMFVENYKNGNLTKDVIGKPYSEITFV